VAGPDFGRYKNLIPDIAYRESDDLFGSVTFSRVECGINHIAKKDPGRVLTRMAAEIGKTEAQVALNWCISKEGVITIPKADSIEHITDNCHASGWRLSPEHVRLLGEKCKTLRTC
jgi:diketogulonate reductase-like aldo/keto reductase